MFECYNKRILRINLDNKTYGIEELDGDFIKKYIGGIGFGTAIVYKEVDPKADALDRANKLTINVGPLTGTRAPMFAQTCIVTKSPLTGGVTNSYAGGSIGEKIKSAGLDSIIVEGKAENLTYVVINNDSVDFIDASDVKGQSTLYTEEYIKKRHGEKFGVISVGLAGENMVRFSAAISATRAFGRGGVGAVFGSKNLKAIAVAGDRDVCANNGEEFEANVEEALSKVQKAFDQPWNLLGSFGKYGTGSGLAMINGRNALATRNHNLSHFEDGDKIDGPIFMNNYPTRLVACFGCPVHCGQVHKFDKGKFQGMVTRGPEYETMYSFGSDILNNDHEVLARAHQLCEEYGMDTLSAGCTMAFATECFEKGIVTEADTGGVDLRFGKGEEMLKMLEKFAKREDAGGIFAEGTKRAAQRLGKGSGAFAMNVKGLEFAAWMPQRMKGIALTFATSNRGACHKRAPVGDEITGKIPMDTTENKPSLVKEIQDRVNAVFTLVGCRFSEFEFPTELFVKLLNSAAGTDYEVEEFIKVGERIWNMERLFNINSGLTHEDDFLPDRCFEPLNDVNEECIPLTRENLKSMLLEYYAVRGWDGLGVPKAETLERLGI